ncbi:MAG: hypothetical protein OK474_02110 [Thaumarchaeota archaeon]|nr:hypothetical protein [Nitrososphaerota archaeon]
MLATIRDTQSLSMVAHIAGVKEIIAYLSKPVRRRPEGRHVRNLSILVVDG